MPQVPQSNSVQQSKNSNIWYSFNNKMALNVICPIQNGLNGKPIIRGYNSGAEIIEAKQVGSELLNNNLKNTLFHYNKTTGNLIIISMLEFSNSFDLELVENAIIEHLSLQTRRLNITFIKSTDDAAEPIAEIFIKEKNKTEYTHIYTRRFAS